MKVSQVSPEDAPRTGIGTGRKRPPDELSQAIIGALRDLQPGTVTVMEFDDDQNMDNAYERVRYYRERRGITETTKQWRNGNKIMVQTEGDVQE